MAIRRDLPRLPIPADRPRDEDGCPIGSRCTPDCRRPSPNQAHCTVCHLTFRALSLFDAHRLNGWCLDPAALGMVESAGLWATPEGHDQMRANAERLAQVRMGAR